jgi:hypothetical protein
MRILLGPSLAVVCTALAVVCAAQAQTQTLEIPPVKTSLTIETQPVEITAWGGIASTAAGQFRLSMTVDLNQFQEYLTPILAAQLNRSERCGERLSVDRAVLAPAAPSALLTAYVHYERFACAKAFGKEVVKRLAGGNAVVEVNLAPSVADNRIQLAADVRKIDADGSLGELLRSGSFGDSLREKIAASIQSSIRKSANLQSALPASMEDLAALQSVQFADGGAGRLWLTIAAAVHLTADQFRDAARTLHH